MKTWNEFVEQGLRHVTDDYGEVRNTRKNSIVFTNGYIGSIWTVEDGYSVSVSDWNGNFEWDMLDDVMWDEYGGVHCKDENEVCEMLTIIEALPNIR